MAGAGNVWSDTNETITVHLHHRGNASLDAIRIRKETTMEAWSTTITTECTCENYNEDTDTFEPTDYCYGDCGEWAWEDATSLIASWAKHWDTNGIRVEASGMTWQSVSAYAELTFHNDNEQALRLFTVDGDYRVELSTTEDGQLTVKRYSHDEPTGCSMVAYPISEI